MSRTNHIHSNIRVSISLLLVLLIVQNFAPLPVAAADPTVSPSPVSLDTIRPGHHQEEDAYLHSRRAGANGQVDGQARLDALRQAGKLPERTTLPAALTGKRATVGRDAAPPRASWTQLGPAPENTDQLNGAKDYRFGKVSGRATSVVVGPNTGVIYLGTAGGGVWKSTDDGVTWNSLTDDQDSLAVGALALDPSDTQDRTLYVGTGETNGSDSYNGIGVLKTTDGGASWQPFGGNTFGTYSATATGIAALVIVGSTVYAATLKGLFSSNSGGTFALASNFSTNGITDLATDGTSIYIVESRGANGNASAGVYKYNGSSGVTAVMTGLPAGSTWGRAQIAIAKSSPQTLYLSIAKGVVDGNGNYTDTGLLGIYTTTNGGGSWTATTSQPADYFGSAPGQGWYDQMIAVDPTNPQIVYAGGTAAVATADGGVTWSTIADVYCSGNALPCHGPIHPDQHAAAFRIVGGAPSVLYVADDGGLWQTTDGRQGSNTVWTSLNTHLSTMAFYSGDAAKNYLNTPIVIGGAQDNGTSRSGYAGYGEWAGILGGDGTSTFVDKANPNTVWAGYPNGSWQTTANDSVGTSISWQNKNFGTACSDARLSLSPLFVPPIAGDTRLSGHVLLGGGGYVCETTDGGVNVYNVTTNQSLASPIHSLTVSRTDSATVYAGMQNGTIARTTNANQPNATKTTGTTWSFCNTSTLPQNTPVTSIITDQNTASTIYVTFGGFGIHHVWMSTDCANWTSLDSGTGLPDVPVNSITEYATSPGPTLVVGTDVGVFISSTQSPSWNRLVNGMPRSVPVDMVFTDVAQTTLFAATHGRGMWEVPIPAANAGSISFDHSTLDFGNQQANGPATSLTVRMTNSGPSAVNVGAVTPAGSSAFTITSNGCANTVLAISGSCPVSVQFSPTAATTYSGAINFNDDGANNPQQVALTGSASIPSGPAVRVTPNPVAFGDTPVGPSGSIRNYLYVTVQNYGAAPLQNIDAHLDINAADDHAMFGISSSTCSNGGLTLQTGEVCRIYMSFIPTAQGARNATLLVSSNATGGVVSVPLTGNGTDPNVQQKAFVGVTPVLDFGSQSPNSQTTQSARITSWGNAGFSVNTITLAADSPNAADFQLSAKTACEFYTYGPSVVGNPPPACSFGVIFSPKGAGKRQAYIDVTFFNNAPSPVRIYLTGIGLTPAVTLDKTSLTFTNVAIGTTAAQDVKITNSGGALLTIQNIGSNGAHFGAYYPNCSTLQPGASCTFQVKFTAYDATTTETAIITITDNTPAGSDSITVSGKGSQPTTTTVSTTDDVIANDGKCSLREAIIAANTNNASGATAGECPAGGTGGTILLAKGAVYNLTIAPAGPDDATTGDLNILASVSIAVTNGGSATIDAGGRGRVMTIGASGTSCAPTVNITGVTLINGKLSSGSVGHSGGGLNIFCGAVTLTDSAVANSSALNNGGGIALQGGDLRVIRSTIDGNTAGNGGGGIYSASTLTVTTSTIFGNTALNGGGGIDAYLDLALTSDTITGNSTGVRNQVNYPIQVQGTIFANVGANCVTGTNGGPFMSGGYNLDSRDNCNFRQTGDLHDVNPNLGPLVFHSGLTQTQALLAGSPAIDQIPATNAICQGTKDQQGLSRPVGPKCDIGAFEYAVVSTIPGPRPPGPPLPPGSPPPVAEPAARSPGNPLPPGSPPPIPAPTGR